MYLIWEITAPDYFFMKIISPVHKNVFAVPDMIIKEMFYIPIKLKPELACASTRTSDVNNQWPSNFQQQII
jgi:hypothetical protein